jgi:hypothetical protein
VAAAFPVGLQMMTYPEGLIKSTVHAAAMYWAYLFSQLGKIIFPVRKKIFLGTKKACG